MAYNRILDNLKNADVLGQWGFSDRPSSGGIPEGYSWEQAEEAVNDPNYTPAIVTPESAQLDQSTQQVAPLNTPSAKPAVKTPVPQVGNEQKWLEKNQDIPELVQLGLEGEYGAGIKDPSGQNYIDDAGDTIHRSVVNPEQYKAEIKASAGRGARGEPFQTAQNRISQPFKSQVSPIGQLKQQDITFGQDKPTRQEGAIYQDPRTGGWRIEGSNALHRTQKSAEKTSRAEKFKTYSTKQLLEEGVITRSDIIKAPRGLSTIYGKRLGQVKDFVKDEVKREIDMANLKYRGEKTIKYPTNNRDFAAWAHQLDLRKQKEKTELEYKKGAMAIASAQLGLTQQRFIEESKKRRADARISAQKAKTERLELVSAGKKAELAQFDKKEKEKRTAINLAYKGINSADEKISKLYQDKDKIQVQQMKDLDLTAEADRPEKNLPYEQQQSTKQQEINRLQNNKVVKYAEIAKQGGVAGERAIMAASQILLGGYKEQFGGRIDFTNASISIKQKMVLQLFRDLQAKGFPVMTTEQKKSFYINLIKSKT